MEPLKTLNAIAMPLVRANINTDDIIPSREMKKVSKTGLSEGLFAGWRYTEIGGREPNPDFVMNDPIYSRSKIILGGVNFGCGSSREHAVWALAEYGFRCIIAPSFAPIFQANCVTNGILTVDLPLSDVEALAAETQADPEKNTIAVDLPAQTLTAPSGKVYRFDISAEAKEMLVEGLDPIDLTLKLRTEITATRERGRAERPWEYL